MSVGYLKRLLQAMHQVNVVVQLSHDVSQYCSTGVFVISNEYFRMSIVHHIVDGPSCMANGLLRIVE